MDASNYSLADIRAATEGDRDDGFGGGAWWIIILFLFVFMGGGNLWGNRQSDYGQYAMAASQQEILYGQQFQGLNSALQRISDGTCNSTYALNNAITGEGRNVQMQLADCCCKTQTAIANLAAQTDRQTCAITTAIHAEGEQTRALMQAAANEGCLWMDLEVRRSNLRAQGLYRKVGFIDVGYRKRYYEDNQEDALLMVCERLPAPRERAGA